MKMNKKYVLLFSSVISSWLLISGCSDISEAPNEKVILLEGAIAREENGNHTNYNLIEGKYSRIDAEKAVVVYDKVSGNYIYEKDGKIFVKYKDKDIEILDKNITNPKLSKSGEYLSYFKKDKVMELVVIKLADNKEQKINSTVAISGNFMDWKNNTIIYYGIDENKKNGIFSYNMESGKEELIYELGFGYLEYLEVLDNGIVFLQETLEGKKALKSINDENQVVLITDEVVELKDIEITEKGIFLLGKMRDENESIYEISNGKFNRLIYDFPNLIHLDRGLSSDEKGNVLFIGSTDNFEEENVYIYEDGYVKSMTNENLKYYFVDIQ